MRLVIRWPMFMCFVMRRTRSCSHLSRGAAGCRECWSTARNGCYSWARGTEGGGHGGFDVEHRGSRRREEKVALAITAHVQKADRDAVRVLFFKETKRAVPSSVIAW